MCVCVYVCVCVHIPFMSTIRGAGTSCYSVCTASDGCLTAAGVGVTVRAHDGTTWHFTPSNPADLVSQLRACPAIGPGKITLGDAGGDDGERATLDAVLTTAPIRHSGMCVIL
jgi:hypothetical protein